MTIEKSLTIEKAVQLGRVQFHAFDTAYDLVEFLGFHGYTEEK